MRHSGFPLYTGSFDCYCFMISLMCQRSFFDCVMQNPNLYRIWSMMWLKEDLFKIESSLRNSFGQTSPTIVIDIIKNSWLRCDIVDHMWNLFKLGW